MKKTITEAAEELPKIESARYAEELRAAVESLAPQVRKRLGAERVLALSAQPQCFAHGGFEAVLQAACEQCAGIEQPLISATVRTLQLCGSTAQPADLEV